MPPGLLAPCLRVRSAGATGWRSRWRWLWLPIALLSPPAFAAVPVEDSVAEDAAPPAQPPQPATEPAGDAPSGVQVYGISQQPTAPAPQPTLPSGPPPPDAGAENASLGALFHQLQVLQQELRTLHGLVEEQAFQIERLARDQKEQYVDLDGRILALSGAPSAQGANAAPHARPSGDPGLLQPPTLAGGSAPQQPSATPRPLPAGSEQEAYNQAFNLMRTQQFDAAAAGFQQILRDYPNGRLAPNCYYWLGELHLSAEEYEQARQQFAQVVNLYGDHHKVPDALYKLGDLYLRLGDNERARTHLQRVRQEYPDSSAANLAQTLAAQLQ